MSRSARRIVRSRWSPSPPDPGGVPFTNGVTLRHNEPEMSPPVRGWRSLVGEDNEELADLLAGQGFPQVARLELDQLLEQLIERARDVQATQGRLRGLLRANLEVARAVDVDQILRHILEAATTLVDAKYAALGVVRDGRLVRFV